MTSDVKVTFKNTTPIDREKFQNSQCLLLISVGSEVHESERFAATANLIDNNFESCIISLYDSLQRFTMALDSALLPEDFHAPANVQGDLWLKRNEKYIDRIRILEDIVRWDQWLEHPHFVATREQLRAATQVNNDYRAAFDSTIQIYLSRYGRNLNTRHFFNEAKARNLCFEYLLEECAVLCLWPELQCEYEIYPNRHNAAMEATRELFIRKKGIPYLFPVRLGFRKTAQVRPQNLEFT